MNEENIITLVVAFTINELKRAIHKLQVDKFPRSSGFPVECFSRFLGTHSIRSIIIGVVKEG